MLGLRLYVCRYRTAYRMRLGYVTYRMHVYLDLPQYTHRNINDIYLRGVVSIQLYYANFKINSTYSPRGVITYRLICVRNFNSTASYFYLLFALHVRTYTTMCTEVSNKWGRYIDNYDATWPMTTQIFQISINSQTRTLHFSWFLSIKDHGGTRRWECKKGRKFFLYSFWENRDYVEPVT